MFIKKLKNMIISVFFLVLFSHCHGNCGFDKFVSMPHLLLLLMYDLTLLMGNMIKPIWPPSKVPVS